MHLRYATGNRRLNCSRLSLTPTNFDRLGAARESTFVLRSHIATPAAELALGLRVQPAIAFGVKSLKTSDQVAIVPIEALVAGTRYRFVLTAPDGAFAGSWAFTTRGPLHPRIRA